MKQKANIFKVTCLLILVVLLVDCKKELPERIGHSFLDLTEEADRVTNDLKKLAFEPFSGMKGNPNDYTFTEVATISPPSINGTEVHACDIHADNNKIYVAYNNGSDEYCGALDILNYSLSGTVTTLSLNKSVAFVGSDINAIITIPSPTDEYEIFLGGATINYPSYITASPAFLIYFKADMISFRIEDLPGYAANSISYASGNDWFAATSGSNAGLSIFNRTTLALEDFLPQANLTASFCFGAQANLICANPVSILHYDHGSGGINTSLLSGYNSNPELKSTIEVEYDHSFLTLNDGGTVIFDNINSTISESITPVNPGNVPQEYIKSNGLCIGDYRVFIANGGGGLTLAELDLDLKVNAIGNVVTGESVNDVVMLQENGNNGYLAIVSGRAGVKIIYYTYVGNAPTVTTGTSSAITTSSVTISGEVTANGGTVVSDRGICLGSSQNPTLSDIIVSSGQGIGTFSAIASGLNSQTKYFARAYAKNNVGVTYGQEIDFTTLTGVVILPPTVLSTAASIISDYSASSGGNVTDNGGASVTDRGVCWSILSAPSISDDKTADGSGLGAYSSLLSGLTDNTTYYYRAYATNSQGTGYGSELSFTTTSGPIGTTFTDPRDGQTYRIGPVYNRIWFLDNLNYDPGTGIAKCFNDDPAYCSKYGKLYDHATALTDFGNGLDICPTGWHVPDLWDMLDFVQLDMINPNLSNLPKAKEYRSITGWPAGTPATNSNGFDGNPGGLGIPDNTSGQMQYLRVDSVGAWLIANFTNPFTGQLQTGNVLLLMHDSEDVISGPVGLGYEASVRCVKDYPPIVTIMDPSNIGLRNATCVANVENSAYATAEERGICWSTSPNPTVNDFKTIEGSGTGLFTSTLTGLQKNTKYYVRAYAKSSIGIGYSLEKTFTTIDGLEFEDLRDGKKYLYGTIGTQTWMFENLAWLPSVFDTTDLSQTEARYYVQKYNGTDVSAAKAHPNYFNYGALYNRVAAMEACPAGWHLPSDNEWKTMEKYLGMNDTDLDSDAFITGRTSGEVGKQLKSTSTWLMNPGDNSSKFNAIPGGVIFPSRLSITLPNNGFEMLALFWNSTIHWDTLSYSRTVSVNDHGVGRSYMFYDVAGSVRCIQGAAPDPTPIVSTDKVTVLSWDIAEAEGEVKNNGDYILTEVGFCFSQSQNPTISDITLTSAPVVGQYNLLVSGLAAGTTYYIRAYATNTAGKTGYGAELSFTTSN